MKFWCFKTKEAVAACVFTTTSSMFTYTDRLHSILYSISVFYFPAGFFSAVFPLRIRPSFRTTAVLAGRYRST